MKSPKKGFNATLFTFLTIISFALVFYLSGCKKTDQSLSKSESGEIEIPEWVKQKALETKKSFTKEFNIKSPVAFLDENENVLSVPFWGTVNSRLATIPCDETDEDFSDNTFMLSTITLNYTPCAPSGGFTMKVKYFLTSAFTPVLVNPNNSSQLSRGRVRIRKRSDGTLIYTNSNITMSSSDIVFVQVDPSNPDKNIYAITYTTPTITGINVYDVYFDNRPIVYSSCADVIITPFDWDATPWNIDDVCARIDPIQILPNGSGSIVFFNGCDAQVQYGGASCYSFSVPRPEEHEIGWRQGSGSFTPLYFTSNPYGCNPAQANSNLPSILTLSKNLSPVTGNVEFRYRNVKRSSTNGCTSTLVCSTANDHWNYVTINVQ